MPGPIINLPTLLDPRISRDALDRLARSLRIVPDDLGQIELARVVMAEIDRGRAEAAVVA